MDREKLITSLHVVADIARKFEQNCKFRTFYVREVNVDYRPTSEEALADYVLGAIAHLKVKANEVRYCYKTALRVKGELDFAVEVIQQAKTPKELSEAIHEMLPSLWWLDDDCGGDSDDVYGIAYSILERIENNIPVGEDDVNQLVNEINIVRKEIGDIEKCYETVKDAYEVLENLEREITRL